MTEIKHRGKRASEYGFRMERKVLCILQTALVVDYVPPEFVHLWQKWDHLFCQVHRYERYDYENKNGIDFSIAIEIRGEIHTRKFGITTSRKYFQTHIDRYPRIKQFLFVSSMDDNRIIQPVLALFKNVIC